MKSFFTGLFAAFMGAITLFLLFLKKKDVQSPFDKKIEGKNSEAEALKSSIKDLEAKKGKPVEDKSLESELDYWKGEKK